MNYETAIDEIYGAVNVAVLANAAAIVGYAPAIYWRDTEEKTVPGADKFWLRVSHRTAIERQANLGEASVLGKRRYRTFGVVFVQVYAPMSDAQAGARLKKLSDVVLNAFRGKTTASGAVFTNCRRQELPPDADCYRLNVVADYSYDEIA